MILLSGKDLSEKLYSELGTDNSSKKLIVITIGEDPASKVYVRNKLKACERVGMLYEHLIFSSDISEFEFRNSLEKLMLDNVDFKVGIILQLPAPQELVDVFNQIIPGPFDVDGFGEENSSLLYTGQEPYHYPATPKGIMTLLDNYGIRISGKHVVILGRSKIVGKPLYEMMLSRNATVTLCHSKSENLKAITKTADILVSAVGRPKLINETYLKDGVVIVDVGINRTEDGIVGDVNFDRVKDRCFAITPVPGGVGPMTVYSLIENVITEGD